MYTVTAFSIPNREEAPPDKGNHWDWKIEIQYREWSP